MMSNSANGSVRSQSRGASLFDALVPSGDVYCEAFSGPAVPRDHWQSLISALDAMGADFLGRRQERARRMRHEDGATFNPFDAPDGPGNPWDLEMIPLPIPTGEWAALEAGLTQRALLLERILADVYGPQELIHQGRLPAELVFANPRFLRPCHGIQPLGSRFLTCYAADIYRGPDGRFRVWRDYCANPAGLGYALENRIVVSRIFPDIFHNTPILRLAHFFQTFHDNLIRHAALQQADPGIVLLSPGPESRIYFEHALLSRYLGYPLVEGQDLTVRNGQVFLKKLAGLEPVAAIFRHIADLDSDPFALRGNTAGGVAGLIQALREQSIAISNPIGSGFAQTPVLPVFLPDLCRHLLDADLILENHPQWWCGQAGGLNHVQAHLDQVILAPALGPTAAWITPADAEAAVAAAPYAYMAWAPLRPAEVPAWDQGAVRMHPYLMRVFACATAQGFTVMPGGLAVSARDVATLLGGHPLHQQSKDIWVLSDRPVAPFSLMSGLQTVAEFRRGSDLPSRVADHLLWLGRYLERAEGLVRLLRAVFGRLAGETRLDDMPEMPFLLELLRARNAIDKPPEKDAALPRYQALNAQLDAALYGRDKVESVVVVLSHVEAAARNVRDRLSLDSWHVINRLEDIAETRAEDPLDLLDDVLFTLSAFSGLAMESMTRGLGWRFMDMGRRVERAMSLTGLIRIGLPQVCTDSRNAMEALLAVADAIITYRSRYRTTFQLAPAMDLLLIDESNPKSLAFQCGRLAAHVAALPRQSDRRFSTAEERMVLEMLTAVRLLDLTGLDCSSGAGIETLTGFLKTMEMRLINFAQQISAHYLTRVAATPHFSMIRGDDIP